MPQEREITEPVDLCTPEGRLDRSSVGWSRRPLHRANLRGWGRTKRWEHWGVVSDQYVLGVTVSSLDYAGVHGVYLLDRSSGREWREDAVVPLARGTVLPDECGIGRVIGRGSGLSIEIRHGLDRERAHRRRPTAQDRRRARLALRPRRLDGAVAHRW